MICNPYSIDHNNQKIRIIAVFYKNNITKTYILFGIQWFKLNTEYNISFAPMYKS